MVRGLVVVVLGMLLAVGYTAVSDSGVSVISQVEAKQAKKKGGAKRKAAPKRLCWQDYCPCEPPQGGPDAGICRAFKAGVHVDEGLLAGAAMMRDGRRQMESGNY